MSISHVQYLIVSCTVAWICTAVFQSLHKPLLRLKYSPTHSLYSSFSLLFHLLPAGLSGTNVLLYLFGFIFSVVVFPIGLVLWMLSCCRVFSDENDDSSRTCYSSPHNSTSESVCSTLYSCILELVFLIVNYSYSRLASIANISNINNPTGQLCTYMHTCRLHVHALLYTYCNHIYQFLSN